MLTWSCETLGRRSRPPPTRAQSRAERPAPPSAAGVAARGERSRRSGAGRAAQPRAEEEAAAEPRSPIPPIQATSFGAGGEGGIGDREVSPTRDTHPQSPPKIPLPEFLEAAPSSPESPLPLRPQPQSSRRGPPDRTSPSLRAPGSAGGSRLGAGQGRRRRAGARPLPGPRRALGAHPWGTCPLRLLARPRPARRPEPRRGGSPRSDPGATTESGRLGGWSSRRLPAALGASRQLSQPCQRPGPPFPGRRHSSRAGDLGEVEQPGRKGRGLEEESSVIP